jgi:hypothetical protein
MKTSSSFRVYYDGAGGEGGAAGGGSLIGEGGGAAAPAAGGTPDAGAGGGGSNDAGFKLPDGWDYRSVLPPELKESPSAKKYANIEELVRGFDNAQQFLGRPAEHLVELPPNAPPEAQRAALEKMGLPKDIGGYTLDQKAVGESIKLDAPGMKTLTEAAFKAGVLPKQLEGLLGTFNGMIEQGRNEMAQAEIKRNADNIAALKNELGEAFDGDVAAANFAVQKLGGKELMESINKAGLGTDAALLKALTKVGKILAEDEGGGDKPNDFGGGMTPDAAKAEGQRLLKEAIDVQATDPLKARELNKKAQEFFARAEKRAK